MIPLLGAQMVLGQPLTGKQKTQTILATIHFMLIYTLPLDVNYVRLKILRTCVRISMRDTTESIYNFVVAQRLANKNALNYFFE